MVMGKKGGAGAVWLLALVSIFVLGTVWITMTEPFDILHDKFSENMSSEYTPTMTKIQTVWNNWPLIMILGIIIGAVIYTIRDSSGDPGY